MSGTDLEHVERIVKAVGQHARTDEATVTTLELMTENSWDLYRSATAKIDLFPTVLGHLNTLTSLLEHAQPPALERRIAVMISHPAQVAGEVAFDVQDLSHAEAYYRLAIEAAASAGHDGLEGIATGRMAFLLVHQRKFAAALQPLHQAARLSAGSITPTARSWIEMMIAEAQSNLADIDSCHRSIEMAKALLSQARQDEDTFGTGFNAATLSCYEGTCNLRLGQPLAAQSALETALKTYTQPTRRRSIILTDLALSLVSQRRVEEACDVGTQALLLAEDTTSSRALQRLHRFQRELRPYSNTSPCVQQFTEQVELVTKRMV